MIKSGLLLAKLNSNCQLFGGETCQNLYLLIGHHECLFKHTIYKPSCFFKVEQRSAFCMFLYRSVITMISSKISNQIQVCSCHIILVACTNYYNYSYQRHQKYSEVDEGIKSVQKQYYRIVLHCYVMF